MRLAAGLMALPGSDPTFGAQFSHADDIGVPWRRPRVRTTQIDGHVFYR